MSRQKLVVAAVAVLIAGGLGYWGLNSEHERPAAANSSANAPARTNDGHGHGHGESHADEGIIHLTHEQIQKAGIKTAEVRQGEVGRDIRVLGTVVTDGDRVAHVVTRVPGIVAEIRKRIGDQVAEGDVLVVLDSRELAEAKADYLAQLRQDQLTRTTLERETTLWKKRISAEQDYLDAKTAAETSRIRLDSARQRLATLGLSDGEIKTLPSQAERSLSRLEVRSPLAGQVIGRNAARGELVAAEKEIFSVGDLSFLWVQIPVYGADVSFVREGQTVGLKGPNGQTGEARVIFVEPTIDPQTGAARAVAEIDNKRGTWRPGDFVSGVIVTPGEPADVVVPLEAIQTIGGESVIFVRTDEGFEKRVVEVGRRNGRSAEILFGLFEGDVIAVGNTFVLKAEASRGEAEHSHSH